MGRVVMCRVCYVPSLSWTEFAVCRVIPKSIILRVTSWFKVFAYSMSSCNFFLLLLALALLICDHLAWRREGWSVCFSCICLFVLYVLVFVLFVFRLVSGVGYGL